MSTTKTPKFVVKSADDVGYVANSSLWKRRRKANRDETCDSLEKQLRSLRAEERALVAMCAKCDDEAAKLTIERLEIQSKTKKSDKHD